MLRRIFGNLIPAIDKLIERIPPHIRDIIQKASIAFAALIALLVIISGINKGLREAQPAGYKLVERNRDLFYLQEMREEYAKKRQLVEDVEVDPLQFPSRQQAADDTRFVTMGRETMGHLMGEKDEMLKSDDALRPKEKSPGYLGDSYPVPRLTPDKKTIEDDEAPLTREKIGSRPAEKVAPADQQPSSPVSTTARPARPPVRDIFDGAPVNSSKAPADTAGLPPAAERMGATSGSSRRKLEFMD
ncbi:MAG: hypothetical protein OHK0011_23530 [Turneriella sp.]